MTAFAAVVGYIPTRAFELHRGRAEKTFGCPAAVRALLDWFVRKLLDALEAVLALLALVFVEWHFVPENRE